MTYGELFLQNEYEMSKYNLDEADIEEQRARFELFDKEARKWVWGWGNVLGYGYVGRQVGGRVGQWTMPYLNNLGFLRC